MRGASTRPAPIATQHSDRFLRLLALSHSATGPFLFPFAVAAVFTLLSASLALIEAPVGSSGVGVLGVLEAVFAGIGVLALVCSPFVAALARSLVHKHVGDAPVVIKLTDRVTNAERWQDEHAEDVKAIPRMADALGRLDETLRGLTRMLVKAGFAAVVD